MSFGERFAFRVLFTVAVMLTGARDGGAQPLGVLYWQLEPFCNVIALHITQHVTPPGAVYAITGFDDQCGSTARGTIAGTATFGHDGSIGVGLTIVTRAGGAPVHVDARMAVATLSGSWVDSAGNTGTIIPLPPTRVEALRVGAPSLTSGPLRPLPANGIAPGSITTAHVALSAIGAIQIAPGAIGIGQIDPQQVQSRIAEDCPAGNHVRAIKVDGSVVCERPAASASAAHSATPGLDLSDADAVVHSVTLTVPTAGTVLVNASGNFIVFRLTGSSTQSIVRARCSISLGMSVDAGHEADVVLAVPELELRKRVRFGLTRGFDVLPGTFKANLVCRHFLQGHAEVDNPGLTALFVPSP